MGQVSNDNRTPDYYLKSGIEVDELMYRATEDAMAVVHFYRGSSMKYRLRAGLKDPSDEGILKDIKKANHCLDKADEWLKVYERDATKKTGEQKNATDSDYIVDSLGNRHYPSKRTVTLNEAVSCIRFNFEELSEGHIRSLREIVQRYDTERILDNAIASQNNKAVAGE